MWIMFPAVLALHYTNSRHNIHSAPPQHGELAFARSRHAAKRIQQKSQNRYPQSPLSSKYAPKYNYNSQTKNHMQDKDWFKLQFPNHLLNKEDNHICKLVRETIRNIQVTNDTGYEWYIILSLILTKDLKMIPVTS